eukprot:CAMPEP_0170184946 /NCGR_PEP_ID=MMETSP0040_2-20121228/35157_1 /TAXON_ID=641309 /ORGANISM="Lotharella oceanica, Strain CCMP622" /LENGTH=82 /DNA_ID=CAMNT_0010431179 /DNA_START=191 /DNA_END=439 /DNA_ORIENTATION=+
MRLVAFPNLQDQILRRLKVPSRNAFREVIRHRQNLEDPNDDQDREYAPVASWSPHQRGIQPKRAQPSDDAYGNKTQYQMATG